MHRRFAPLFFAVLLALPAAVPAGAAEAPAPQADAGPRPAGALDATGRYIVLLRKGADTTATVDRAARRDRVKADRTYKSAVHGFAAKLDAAQRHALAADPAVAAIVPDGIVELTQSVPTGVSRVGGKQSEIAAIDEVDELDHRVDADVAIVDTGIAYHPDLNVAGGYNCSTADRTAWRDRNNHGTHVAGTVGAIDNTIGVVGVAPGARVWGVKILNDDGYGLISWYICGLDWIAAQRDPVDPSRPLFEAVNMSVTKAGSDDRNCGFSNNDPLHQAICRVVDQGITVVAAAANDSHNASKNVPASYNEVITVSALADTDGKPGGTGAATCYSWGGYDRDDTFADFSNYGADVDIMAPGKCIRSTIPGGYGTMSGTSMAAPTVTGAVALYKASRPNATPGQVKEALQYLGNLNWKTSTDPDPYHEPLLDVSRIFELGTFEFDPSPPVRNVEAGTVASVTVRIVRSPTFFERVTFAVTTVPDGWAPDAASTSAMGWTDNGGKVSVVVPAGTPAGTYELGVRATNQGRVLTTTIPVRVVEDDPTALPPVAALQSEITMGTGTLRARVTWPEATDPTSAIAGYQVQLSRDGGPWTGTLDRAATSRQAQFTVDYDTPYRFRVRAVDAAGHWSPWVVSNRSTRLHPVDERSDAVGYKGTWRRVGSDKAYANTLRGSSRRGATATMAFTGRGIALVASTGPNRGRARIYIDGTFVARIDLRGPLASRQVVFARSLGGGDHHVTVRVVGRGDYRLVRLDAFVIQR